MAIHEYRNGWNKAWSGDPSGLFVVNSHLSVGANPDTGTISVMGTGIIDDEHHKYSRVLRPLGYRVTFRDATESVWECKHRAGRIPMTSVGRELRKAAAYIAITGH